MSAGRTSKRKTHVSTERPPFERIALILQGGGALGAYQAGVYQALAEASLHPDWVAGVSIGAANAALIAGNPPEKRVQQLRAFWETVSSPPFGFPTASGASVEGEYMHAAVNQWRSMGILLGGAPGFFTPRIPPPYLHPPGSPEALSFYDVAPLKATLERLVDFDRINAGAIRFSVGATNVRTGNFVYFDSTTHQIGPEHVMASGSLPPGFPATEIEGRALLGRRAGVQYAAAMGARQQTASGHAGLPDRSLERAAASFRAASSSSRCARRTSAFPAAPGRQPISSRGSN